MNLSPGYFDYPFRRPGMDHGRYAHSNLFKRKPAVWPEQARIALWIVPTLEFFPLDMAPKGVKPPGGLEGAPWLVEHGISVAGLTEAKCVFEGNAVEGARGFPANVNVAAALGLAGIGPEHTRLQIWADPAVDRNVHTIEVEADSARFSLRIENVPSAENPRTGRITALSVIACLRGLTAPLRVGT